ncbi:hypothetical protein BDFB_006034, partial [Asbolus verrucosus]
QEAVPIQLDCSILDVDANGVNDCLLLDERGLKAIETISGQVIWHVHSHEERKSITIAGLDFPIKLLDYNNDNINELAAVYKKKSLLLICGRTGKALDKIDIKFNDDQSCKEIGNLRRSVDKIVFTCSDDLGTGTVMKIPFSDLWKKYNNSSYVIKPSRKGGDSSINENVFSIGNRKLIVNNAGVCPNCRANIELIESNSDKKKIWPYNNASIMTPKLFHFQPTKSNLFLFKGHINGFILKIWQWSSEAKSQINKFAKHSRLSKRNISKNDSYFINSISERVVLITFNDTNVHVINASLTAINQLCTSLKDNYVCQPDLKSQENSILVGDLDQDGSQELISYSSTYVLKEDQQNWSLVSNIKVIRLEAELPKLYEEK